MSTRSRTAAMTSRYGMAGYTAKYALGHVQLHLAEGLAHVGRVLLVGAAVALQRGLDGLAERAVEGAGVLRGVGQDRYVLVAGLVQGAPDDTDLAIHHSGRADHVRPGGGLHDCH